MNNQVGDQIRDIFSPLGKRACPIFKMDLHGTKANLIGTGVPIIEKQVGYLLTAAHVLKDIPPGQLAIAGSRQFLHIPDYTANWEHNKTERQLDVDVAAVALPARAVEEMQEFYTFTHARECEEFEGYAKTTFYGAVGYPASKGGLPLKHSDTRTCKSWYYVTNKPARWGDVTTPGKDQTVHFALQVGTSRQSSQSLCVGEFADPHGISGCGIWKVKIDPHSGIVSAPRLVGVCIEHLTDAGVIVATRLSLGAIIISELRKRIDEGHASGPQLYLERNLS
jgi:hypothetical protein